MGRCISNKCKDTEEALADLKSEEALRLLSALLDESSPEAEAEISGTWAYDTHIQFENRLNVPVFVKGECTPKLLTEETKILPGKRSVSRKFENVIRSSGFTKIGPHADWTGYYPKVGKKDEGCQPVYVSYYVEKANGVIALKQTRVENGKKMIIKDTPENLAVHTDAMCHGSYRDCGCYKGYCTSKCGRWQGILGKKNKEWCYTTKGTKGDREWVKCSHDKQCHPDWSCGGFCSAGW